MRQASIHMRIVLLTIKFIQMSTFLISFGLGDAPLWQDSHSFCAHIKAQNLQRISSLPALMDDITKDMQFYFFFFINSIPIIERALTGLE